MSRERFIDPGIWSSEQFCNVGLQARLLFIGCITHADDCGFLPASVHGLKVKVFPSDNEVTRNDVAIWLDELLCTGLVQAFGEPHDVLWLPRFIAWQPLKWRSKSKALTALVEAGQFSQDLDDRGRVVRCCPVQAGTEKSSQVQPGPARSAPKEPPKPPEPASSSQEQAGIAEGRGGESSRGDASRAVSCREEGSIQTPSVDVRRSPPSTEAPPPADAGPAPVEPEAKPAEPETTPTSGIAPSGAGGNGDGKKPVETNPVTDKDHVFTPLTSGIVALWQEEGKTDDELTSANHAQLCIFMRAHDKANPAHLLAHVREIDQSTKIKHKLRALYNRLRGKERIEPSDAAIKWANEKLNGGAGKGGQPESVADVLPKTEQEKKLRKGLKEPHPSVMEEFERLTSTWRSSTHEEKARELAFTMMGPQPAFVIGHCMAINAGQNRTCPPWKDLRGRLGTAEKLPRNIKEKAEKIVADRSAQATLY